jgi:Major Facilitator Superfamily
MTTTVTAPAAGSLTPDVRRTYACHWVYSALSGINAGILTNAQAVSIKALKAADWQLVLPITLSGVGMLATLLLGVWMARQRKMPFVLIPGFISCAANLAMVISPQPLAFLVLLGLSNLFETLTRPAIAAIIRSNYPVETRGWVTGTLRRCSVVTFLVAALAAGRLLDLISSWQAIQWELAAAAVLQMIAFAALALIRVVPDGPPETQAHRPESLATIGSMLLTLRHDTRFLTYLVGCVLFASGNLMYEPLVRAYLAKDMGLNYTQCAVLADVLPSLISVLTLERLGEWLDRTNPLLAWAIIRVSWGIDPLLMAIAPFWPAGAILIAAIARIFRGGVMNGSWLLWWQLGSNYFTGRKDMTSVYNGLLFSLNGVQRISAPMFGAFIGAIISRREVLVLGGCLVLISALHAWRQAQADKVDGDFPTFTDKELVGHGLRGGRT